MEERRKNIKDLEQKKQGEFRSVNLMLEDLGEALVSRMETGEGAAGALSGEYQRIQREIADSEGLITAIQEDIIRLGQVEEAISFNDRTLFRVKQDLGGLYYGLGERVLEDETHGEFTEPYRRQLDTLRDKVKSLEGRIEDLAGRETANILVQLGRNTQFMLFRSSLEKTQSALRRIYETVGEKFASREEGTPEDGGEIARSLEEIGDLVKQAETLRAEADRLKEDKRKIADTLNFQGGPVKRIGSLEKKITQLKNERRMVFVKYGELALEKDREGEWGTVFDQGNRLLLQKIEETRNYIREIENRIEKIKASLAIDEERAVITKMEKTIGVERGRIAAAEKAIEELEERIHGAQQHIEELKKIEAYGNKN
ncbi:MAG: hypothetical protein LBC60_10565 [Spirochaetaceae bacterium]|nr:hypothetical protein [Spirochaetaceae bacterium]